MAPSLVTKLGVVLLVLAGSYALALRVLGRIRDAAHQAEVEH
jgi:hypothetical protein